MHSINTRKIILISKNFKQAGYVEDNTRFKKRMKKKKTGKKLKKCRLYDTVMLIIFHGVSIFELITREKKERKKKGKRKRRITVD